MNPYSDLVSVVVTIFNVEPYLDTCISSLLHQSYSHIEIVLVDDGSSDASGKICDLYKQKDKRVVVIHQKNKGFGPASNAGIDRATGKFLMFCDGDDYYFPTAVEHMIAAIKRTHADVAHAAGFAFDNVTGSMLDEADVNIVSVPNVNNKDVLNRKDIITFFPLLSVYCWTNIINLQWLRRHHIRWPTAAIDYVDNPFHCNLMIHINHLAIVREQICAHRMNRVGSAMHKVKVPQMFEALKISEKLIKNTYPQLLGSFYRTLFCNSLVFWQQDRNVMDQLKQTVLWVLKSKIALDPQTKRACEKILKYNRFQPYIVKGLKFITPSGIAKRVFI